VSVAEFPEQMVVLFAMLTTGEGFTVIKTVPVSVQLLMFAPVTV
jgi:hypothetical protein